MLPSDRDGLTLSLGSKTVRPTEKMKNYTSPLHIVSAKLSELGITFGSKSVDGKSNEIPAVQELLKDLDIARCLVVADALSCQKETAKVIIKGEADYLLSVKANQPALMQDIVDYVQNDSLRVEMETQSYTEKNRERVEKRTAFVIGNIDWLNGKEKWHKVACVGTIHIGFETNSEKNIRVALLYFQPLADCG